MVSTESSSNTEPTVAPPQQEPTRTLQTVPLDLSERRALMEQQVRAMYRSTAAVLAVPLILIALCVSFL